MIAGEVDGVCKAGAFPDVSLSMFVEFVGGDDEGLIDMVIDHVGSWT